MEKRKFRIVVVMVFGVTLLAASVLDGSVSSTELAMLQGAMRELRRTDNLEFSYENILAEKGTSKSEKAVIWADTLSGSWVGEYYITDEDGTRRYLKKFCDGESVYEYVEWSGEWDLLEEEEDSIPYFSQITDLPYDDDDILDIRLEQQGNLQEVSYEFTTEYMEKQNRRRIQMLEDYYKNYQRLQTSDESQEQIELAAEQYRQTSEEKETVVCHIDPTGVMQDFCSVLTLSVPEIIYDDAGGQTLGAEAESIYETKIKIHRYNQDAVLNKIEQCRGSALLPVEKGSGTGYLHI